MFYELVYENGDSSVMQADSDEEALEGIKEANKRAVSGQKSLASDPSSPPAVRIKRVFAYDKHPNEYNVEQNVKASEASEALKALTENSSVNIPQLVSTLRGLTDPMVNNSAPHESKFHMEATRELDSKEWADAA